MIRITLASIVLVCTASAVAGQKDTVRAMARFDKAFIPAYFATIGDGSVENARSAVAGLEEAWETLRHKHFDAPASTARSGYDTAKMQELVEQAAARIARDGARPEAHMALVELRHALSAVRKADGIPYLLDHVVEAQRFVVTVTMHLDHGDKELVQETLSDAAAAWENVTGFALDKVVYGVDYYSLGEMALHRASATQWLEEAQAAAEAADWDDVRSKTGNAAGHIESYYKLFGDFDSLE